MQGSKGKEIGAIKELLESLTLQEGDAVTIDAICCQKEIVKLDWLKQRDE